MSKVPASNRSVATSDNELITPERLRSNLFYFETELSELEAQASRVPTRITDEKTQGSFQDLIKDLDKLGKELEAERKRVKQPYLTACGIVDSTFKSMYEESARGTPGRLNIARLKVSTATDDFMIRKEAAERKRLADEAAALREEQRKADETRRKAEEAQHKAEEEGRTKTAANQERKADDAAADASMAGAHAFELEQQAKAKPAELARVRSDGGTLGTLKLSWDFRIDNLSAVKGAPLWAFVTAAAKEAAIRAYVKENGPEELPPGEDWQPLVGVTMVQKRTGQYR